MAIINGEVANPIPEIVYVLDNGMDIGRQGNRLVVFKKATKKLVSPAFRKHKDLVEWIRNNLMN